MAAPPAQTPPAARVIKDAEGRAQPLYPATRLLKGAVLDAQRIAAEANELFEKTKAESQAIRQGAIDEADAVRNDAFQHGAQRAAEEVAQLLGNFQSELERTREQLSHDIQRLAFKLAKVILDVEFSTRPEHIVKLVSSVLGHARLYNRIEVHLHPNDVEFVRPHQEQLKRQLAFANEIRFCADEELPLHGVRIETEMGSYDGSIEVQLRRLEEHLLGASPKPTSAGDQP